MRERKSALQLCAWPWDHCRVWGLAAAWCRPCCGACGCAWRRPSCWDSCRCRCCCPCCGGCAVTGVACCCCGCGMACCCRRLPPLLLLLLLLLLLPLLLPLLLRLRLWRGLLLLRLRRCLEAEEVGDRLEGCGQNGAGDGAGLPQQVQQRRAQAAACLLRQLKPTAVGGGGRLPHGRVGGRDGWGTWGNWPVCKCECMESVGIDLRGIPPVHENRRCQSPN